MAVRVDLNISLDGFATTTDQTPESPFGEDWPRLVSAYASTRTFRERVLHDTTGEGSTGVDDSYARAYFDGIGAEIMGAGMFGFHANPADPNWRGWWGDEPPFDCPVYVLTHRVPRPDLTLGGTTFRFLSASPDEVLRRALDAAGDRDVRIGGGGSVVTDYLRAGLVDQLHVAIAPIILGQGLQLWEGLRGFEGDYDVTSEIAESGTIHVTFRR